MRHIGPLHPYHEHVARWCSDPGINDMRGPRQPVCITHFATPSENSIATPVSRARSSPVPGVVAYGEWPITARTTPHVTNHRGACRLQTFRRSRSSRLGSRKEEYRHCCHIWHVFIFNYVEFTQGKLRIARDRTVNDYLCCNSVLLWNVWAHLPYRLSSLTNDRHVWFFRTRIMRRLGCKLFITSHLCYMSLMSRSVDHTSKK